MNKTFDEHNPADYPEQTAAALEYVAANSYDYGHSLSKVPLIREVVGVQNDASGTLRVFIQYRPRKGKSKPGLEYVDVAEDCSVLARRQVRLPKQSLMSLSWLLIVGAIFSVIAAAILTPGFLVFGFFEQSEDFRAGRSLLVRLDIRPRTVPELYYTDVDPVSGTSLTRVVRPSESGNEIAYIRVNVVNQNQSQQVRFILDSSAAELQADTGRSYRPLDVPARSLQDIPNSRYLVDGFQYIWGSVTLLQGFGIEGYLVFEVPIGSKFSRFVWSAGGDTIFFPLN